MSDLRITDIFYDQRGPLVLSASLHLVLLVFFAIWLLASPEKKPEELVFELVSAPPPGAAERPTLEQLRYQSEQVDLPTEEEIVLPERPMIPAPKPEPVVEKPAPREEPVVVETPKPRPVEQKVVERPEPKPQQMSLEDFQKQFGPIKPTNIRKQAPPQQRTVKVDVSDLARNLADFDIDNRSTADINASSASDQQELSSYLSRFRATVRRNLENHPFSGSELVARVQCDISANGYVSNARIIASSGDPQFDRKALAAFKSVRVFDSPPDNQPLIGVKFTLKQK